MSLLFPCRPWSPCTSCFQSGPLVWIRPCHIPAFNRPCAHGFPSHRIQFEVPTTPLATLWAYFLLFSHFLPGGLAMFWIHQALSCLRVLVLAIFSALIHKLLCFNACLFCLWNCKVTFIYQELVIAISPAPSMKHLANRKHALTNC